jgi:hypothetical protein
VQSRCIVFAVGVVSGLACTRPAAADITGGILAPTGNDVVARYFHAAGTLPDGTVMVTGGLALQFFPPSLISRTEISFYDAATGQFGNEFDPLDGGPAVTVSLIEARSSHTQTTLYDGRVLITGGNVGATGTSPGVPTDTVEIFDPHTGLITGGDPMASPRAMHTATRLPNHLVLVAGDSSWQLFDPWSNDWSDAIDLARSRSAHAAVLLTDHAGTPGDDRVLLIGGGGSGPTTLELVDPAEGTSALLTAALGIGVDDLAATRLPDGRVFVVGGQDVTSGDSVPNTYVVDPVADTIAAGPDAPGLPGGIADHQLVRFGPYVYVMGGEQQSGGVDTVLDYIAVYDSDAGDWMDNGTMNDLRDDFAVAPLGGCTVLLVDGGIPLLDAEAPTSNCETLEITLADACRAGDLDNDADVDLRDYALFADCLSGPEAGMIDFRCRAADLDGDGAVDLSDAAIFAYVISAPVQP